MADREQRRRKPPDGPSTVVMDLTGPRRGGRANELGRRGPAQRCTAGRRGGVSGGGAPGGIKLAVEETRA